MDIDSAITDMLNEVKDQMDLLFEQAKTHGIATHIDITLTAEDGQYDEKVVLALKAAVIPPNADPNAVPKPAAPPASGTRLSDSPIESR